MTKKRVSSVTLAFDELEIYGRDAELKKLLDAFRRIYVDDGIGDAQEKDDDDDGRRRGDENGGDCSRGGGDDRQSPTTASAAHICLKGPAGCGKTALLEKFLKTIPKTTAARKKEVLSGSDRRQQIQQQQPTTHVVVGRSHFEEHQPSLTPLLAVTEAVDDVLRQLMEWEDQGADCGEWKQTFTDNFGTDAQTLGSLLPSIRMLGDKFFPRADEPGSTACVVATAGASDCEQSEEPAVFSNVQQLFLAALRSLLRAICGQQNPRIVVVLVLGDLQWADGESLNALEYLLLDSEQTVNLFFISTHRTTNLDNDDLEQLLVVSRRKGMTEIELKGLELPEMTQLIARLLKRSPEEARPLAVIVHHKTGGNASFALEFLRLLEARDLLHFSPAYWRWEWDTDRILAETDLSENVAGVVADKITSLPEAHQLILSTYACLRCRSPWDVR